MHRDREDRAARGLYWDRAWSLVSGCTPVGPECDHCWAAAEARMRGAQRNAKIREVYAGLTDGARFNGAVRIRADLLGLPIREREPTTWAVWTDLFHEAVPFRFLVSVHATMALAPQHRYLVLTKRPELARAWWDSGCRQARMSAIRRCVHQIERSRAWSWGWERHWDMPQIAVGTTIGCQIATGRVDALHRCECVWRFLSIEPLLGRLYLPEKLISNLHWAVIGCESGSGRRPCKLDWVRDLVEQLRRARVRIWVKQLDLGKRIAHRLEEFPEDLRIRERPPWAPAEEEGRGEKGEGRHEPVVGTARALVYGRAR